MDTLSQMRAALRDDFTVDSSSSLLSSTTLDLAINRAYRKAGALFPWPSLMDAKKTITESGQETYDYPQAWRSNSIWKLAISDSDGKDIRWGEDPDGSPLSFDDYLIHRQDYPDSTDKKWANQERRFFIAPVPAATGSLSTGINVISVWGIKNVTSLSEDADETIFSYQMPECNEAVVLEASAILKSKGNDDKSASFRSTEAKQILAVSWGKIRAEQQKYEKNQPMFEVQNFYGNGSTRDLRGRFE